MTVCKEELKRELVASLAAGVMTERFAVLASKIVQGYFSQRSMGGYSEDAKEDFLGEFHVRLVKKWQLLNPEKNVLAAITQLGRWAGMDVKRRYKSRRQPLLNDECMGSFSVMQSKGGIYE